MVGKIHGLRSIVFCVPNINLLAFKRKHAHNQDDDLYRLVLLHHGCAAILEMKMRVEKPWGYEDRWAITDKYLGKILYIKAGHRLSLQYHEQKDETIYVLEGSLLLELGPLHERRSTETGIKVILKKGESQRIHPGLIHRYSADKGDVVLIEVSTAEINDVVRLQDDYKRGND